MGGWGGSTDPAEQFWSSYMYCAANPVSLYDTDGQLCPISHLIQGGWNEMMGDFYREDFNFMLGWNCFEKDKHLEDKIRLTNIMHSEFQSTEDVDKFFSEHTADEYGLTEAQWRGYRKHAYDDMGHEAHSEDQMWYSPLECLIHAVDTKAFRDGGYSLNSSKALADYQDISGIMAVGSSPVMILLGGMFLPVMPITGSLLISGGVTQQTDFVFSMFTHLGQNTVNRVQQEGFGNALGSAAIAEAKQVGVEVATFPLVTLSPVGLTIFTTKSVIGRIKHIFLQD